MVLLMLVGGLLGGIVNYLTGTNADAKSPPWTLRACISAGVASAFIVPLALNLIASNMVDNIVGKTDVKSAFKDLMLLFAFSILAAIVARRFLSTMADKMLKQINEAKSQAHAAAQKADSADRKAETANLKAESANAKAETASTLLEANTEPELDATASTAGEYFLEVPVLSADQKMVLAALGEGRYALRSVSGISRETGLGRDTVNGAISQLMTHNLVGQIVREKGPRWYATPEGRSYLAAQS